MFCKRNTITMRKLSELKLTTLDGKPFFVRESKGTPSKLKLNHVTTIDGKPLFKEINEGIKLLTNEGRVEQFVPVGGYEGLYEVSNYGRVKSCNRIVKSRANSTRTVKERLLKPWSNERGYKLVDLCVDSTKQSHRVHRLVCQAFLINHEGKSQVNHIDGDKTNNSLDNLEWSTIDENIAHAFKLGLRCNKGVKNALAKLTEEDVISIRELYAKNDITQKELSKKFNIVPSQVSKIISKEAWPHI